MKNIITNKITAKNKKTIFITGSSGSIGKRIYNILYKNKNLNLFKVSIKLQSDYSEFYKFFKNKSQLKNKKAYLIHCAYDWNDKRVASENSNFIGSMNLFNAFLSSFNDSTIINISTTVAHKENPSSYSQVKLKIQDWLEKKNHISLVCGIFIDFPSFGQNKILEKISKYPILFIPCKYSSVYLSSISILIYTINNILSDRTKFENKSILCCTQPILFYNLIEKMGDIYYGKAPIVFNLPFKPVLFLFKLMDRLLIKSRLEEKLLGLNSNLILNTNKKLNKNLSLFIFEELNKHRRFSSKKIKNLNS
jgi:flavodoxin